MPNNFFDLTERSDRFEITPGLITTSPDGIRALGGNDTVTGSQGADTISGNRGDDVLSGSGGPDVLTGGRNWDTLDGGSENDVLFGNRGNDLLLGNEGADLIHGGKGSDLLRGGEGNDSLWGDLGADTLEGGEGQDIFILRPDDTAFDTIIDWDFNTDRIGLAFGLTPDQIQVVPLPPPQASPSTPADNVSATGVTLQLGTGQVLAVVPNARVEQFTTSRFVIAG